MELCYYVNLYLDGADEKAGIAGPGGLADARLSVRGHRRAGLGEGAGLAAGAVRWASVRRDATRWLEETDSWNAVRKVAGGRFRP